MSDQEAKDLGLIPPAVDETSPRGRLLAKRRKAVAAVTKDLDVWGYGGELVARYRLLDPLVEGKEITDKVTRNYTNPTDQGFYGILDTLIAACVGLYYRDPETGVLTLIDEDGLGPMGYDQRAAEYFGFPTDSARDTVIKIFNGYKTSILAHVRELNEWMEHPTSAATLGEA